jgi:cellulose synthase/poly-beta-1,6-N-acetylglucosamine synthase-like glycosyltransferase
MHPDPASLPLTALFLATSWAEQANKAFFDDTFSGITPLNWFDYSLLIPYFVCLIVLSIYGLHRYEVIHSYLKARKADKGKPVAAPGSYLPKVTIQLPLYNERFVVERLLESVSQVEYPRELLQIQVLDDSTDETHPFTERLVNEYRAQGFLIDYIHRTNRHGFKAGALEEGLASATGEVVAVFDADFVIPNDFLLRTVHHFADPKVGVVQTRWSYLNRDYSALTEVQAMLLDGHFVLEHAARAGNGLYFNFNGTAGILRKAMIRDAGGWQHDTLTEDSDLSYRAQLKGWKFVYVPEVECPSELPVDMLGFQTQQFRWSKGLTQVAIKLLRQILKSDAPLRVKFEAFAHLTPNLSYPLMITVTALMLPVMIVRFYQGWQQLLLIDVPFMTANFLSVIVFYTYTQKERNGGSVWKAIRMMPALVAAGVALTINNTRAFFEAIIGHQTEFVRTPKYAINGTEKAKAPALSKYRSKVGVLPWLELVLGTYFLAMVFYAIDTYNFLAVPLVSIFVAGYYWAAFAKLHFEWKNRMAWQRAQKLAGARS